jgi:hypothetical protein
MVENRGPDDASSRIVVPRGLHRRRGCTSQPRFSPEPCLHHKKPAFTSVGGNASTRSSGEELDRGKRGTDLQI